MIAPISRSNGLCRDYSCCWAVRKNMALITCIEAYIIVIRKLRSGAELPKELQLKGCSMRVTSTALIASLVLLAPGMAFAQPAAPGASPQSGGAVIQSQPNTTGNDRDVVISRGATGAETATTNSAAGGNASQPSRAVPGGSAGSGNSR